MNRNSQQIEFSYYELSLLSFLRESHPDKSGDIAFIKTRSAQAAEAYSDAFDNGFPIPLCVEIANRTLFRGLHFSKHDIIKVVLNSEFTLSAASDNIADMAVRLQSLCEEIFAEYTLDDEFASTPQFDLLYTELTGAIQLKLEEDGSL